MIAGLELPGGGLFPNKTLVDAYKLDRIGWPTHVEAPDGTIVWNPILDRNQNGNVNVIEDVRNNWKKTVFLFRALWGWTGTPEAWADAFKADLGKLDLLKTDTHAARQCALDADLEVDNSEWLMRACGRLLEIMVGRGITLSLQPMKGGLISDGLVDFINNQKWLTIAPFKYRNDMRPVSERCVIDNLLARGIAEQKILIWYERYEEGFDGFLYGIK